MANDTNIIEFPTRPHPDTNGFGLLGEELAERAAIELIESASGDEFAAALDALNDMAIQAAMYNLWVAGDAKVRVIGGTLAFTST